MNKAFYYPSTSVDYCKYKVPVLINNDRKTSLGTYYSNINDSTGYIFKTSIEPQLIDDKIKITFNENSTECNSKYKFTGDSRLIDPIRNQKLFLDRNPDMIENLSFEDMYISDKLRNYGKRYTGYDDINAGQIKYWRWNTPGMMLERPIYSTSANVIGSVYIDPMDNIKPVYKREPIVKRNLFETNNIGGLSFVNDTNDARENITASLKAKMDQNKYQMRWQ